MYDPTIDNQPYLSTTTTIVDNFKLNRQTRHSGLTESKLSDRSDDHPERPRQSIVLHHHEIRPDQSKSPHRSRRRHTYRIIDPESAKAVPAVENGDSLDIPFEPSSADKTRLTKRRAYGVDDERGEIRIGHVSIIRSVLFTSQRIGLARDFIHPSGFPLQRDSRIIAIMSNVSGPLESCGIPAQHKHCISDQSREDSLIACWTYRTELRFLISDRVPRDWPG